MRILFRACAAAAIVACTASMSSAQVPTALLRAGDPLPAAGPGHVVEFLNNTSVNGLGGYSCTISTDDGITTLSHVWGDFAGGPGAILRTESTIGNYQQTAFESFYGMGNSAIGYGTTSNDLVNLISGLDQVWSDGTSIAVEGDVIPSILGKIYRFNSRPTMTRNDVLHWVGGIDDQVSGANEGNGLFRGNGQVLVKSLDQPAGLPAPISTSGVDFDFAVSANATHWFAGVDTTAPSNDDFFLLVDGVPETTYLGALVGENQPLPYQSAGLPGEVWDNFDNMGVTESGHTFFTGDSDGAGTATDEFVARNNIVIYREGDVVDGETLTGAMESAAMNDLGDIAYVWDVVNGTSSVEALFLNDKLILKEGDPVDFNGDGVIDALDGIATAIDFVGIATMAIDDDRTMYTTVDVDINGTTSSLDDVEVLVRITEPCGGVRRFGRGCEGSGGFEPVLNIDGCVTIGGTVTLRIERGLGGSMALLFFGTGQAEIAVGGGCKYNLSPVILAPIAIPLGGVGPGNGSISFPVTIDPLTSPQTFTMQAWVLDPGAPIGGVGTDGLEIDLIP